MDPYSLPDKPDFLAALNGDLKGKRIAYNRNFGVYPVDPRVAAVVASAVRSFEKAGAVVEEVDIKLPYDQRELSDLWCRLIMPLNIGAFEGFKCAGLDLLRDHRDSFPPEYLKWVEHGYRMSVTDIERDQTMRSVVSDAIQSVFNSYDFLVTPTLAAMQVDNATDGNTLGPKEINDVAVDPLIGWCMTYFLNFTGHPAASIPAGLVDGRYPVGMQIIGRRYDDAGVLTASSVFEQIQPWEKFYQLCRQRSLS